MTKVNWELSKIIVLAKLKRPKTMKTMNQTKEDRISFSYRFILRSSSLTGVPLNCMIPPKERVAWCDVSCTEQGLLVTAHYLRQ